ncbi:hypothetical protein [Methylophaga thiooxydans]|uniref:Uncharacterized protein n=1 Tax=Methylophaga thiooxydans DMS010 TaxID=637616 RepID=C0N319_9GAMM|nr:hypothetical protein [Methylophaga thiooxydans]EEF80300.1 hypothetical protein MDMS009_1196 [Methylophaga thiooxydans DMS010]EEF80847.1 hypothetical protein MDMS009_574 [Methylophaga thiooxydans DMS010]
MIRKLKNWLLQQDIKSFGKEVLKSVVIFCYIIAAGYFFGVGMSHSYSPITISVETTE